MAVALALLVLLADVLGALVPDPLGAVVVTGFPAPLTAPLVDEVGETVVGLPAPLTAILVVVDVGDVLVVPDVAVGLVAVVVLGLLVIAPATGAVVPLAAVPEPLTVVAFTVVEPEEFTLPDPLLVAPTTVEPMALVRVTVELGAVDVAGAVVVAVAVGLVAPPVTVAVVPLAATPEPLTVAALTVVEPVEFTLPEPLLVASTLVEPEAFVLVVIVVVGLAVPVILRLLCSTGAAVPLAATPLPLNVVALTVVEPPVFVFPEPLLMALTVLEPMALVVVVCAMAGLLPSITLSKPALTAVEIVLLRCDIFSIMHLLTVSPYKALPTKRDGGLKDLGGTMPVTTGFPVKERLFSPSHPLDGPESKLLITNAHTIP
jgi:hypothetical protein